MHTLFKHMKFCHNIRRGIIDIEYIERVWYINLYRCIVIEQLINMAIIADTYKSETVNGGQRACNMTVGINQQLIKAIRSLRVLGYDLVIQYEMGYLYIYRYFDLICTPWTEGMFCFSFGKDDGTCVCGYG